MNFDIDIDFGDRTKVLELIKCVPAAMRNVTPMRKHNTGVYITEIPYDPVHDMASIDYTEAEERGYMKLDLLNVHVYDNITSEVELIDLMREPNWELLKDKTFVESLIHLGNHFQSMQRMPELIDSIPRLAMFLAIIRPGKKHLIGLPWAEVAKTVWERIDGEYTFKKSHSCAYAQLIVVQMNLLESKPVGEQE